MNGGELLAWVVCIALGQGDAPPCAREIALLETEARRLIESDEVALIVEGAVLAGRRGLDGLTGLLNERLCVLDRVANPDVAPAGEAILDALIRLDARPDNAALIEWLGRRWSNAALVLAARYPDEGRATLWHVARGYGPRAAEARARRADQARAGDSDGSWLGFEAAARLLWQLGEREVAWEILLRLEYQISVVVGSTEPDFPLWEGIEARDLALPAVQDGDPGCRRYVLGREFLRSPPGWSCAREGPALPRTILCRCEDSAIVYRGTPAGERAPEDRALVGPPEWEREVARTVLLRLVDEWAGGRSHRLLRPWPGALFQVVAVEPEDLTAAPRLVEDARQRVRELHAVLWEELGLETAEVPRLEPVIRLTVTDARPSAKVPLPELPGAEPVPLSDWR